jgi:hypothetical protein
MTSVMKSKKHTVPPHQKVAIAGFPSIASTAWSKNQRTEIEINTHNLILQGD